jgi:hypothetical protein
MRRTPATQLTLEYLRCRGVLVDICERIIPMPGRPFPKKHDLFNAFDVHGVDNDGIGYYVQTTGGKGNFGARISKMRHDPKILEVIRRIVKRGNRVEVHGWTKVERNYQVRVALVTVKDGRFEWDDAEDVPSLQQARAQARAAAKALPLFDEVVTTGEDEEEW